MRVFKFFILMSLAMFFGCTENPFYEDVIKSADGLTVAGHVNLSDNTSPDGIYVWMEELNVGTFTDENGDFLLSLPSPSAQPGGGLSGEFNLYYYMGNYKLETQQLLFVRGNIKYGEAKVDEQGTMNPVTLQLLGTLQVFLDIDQFRVSSRSDFWLEYSISNVMEGFSVQIYKDPRIPLTIANIFFIPVHGDISETILYATFEDYTHQWVSSSITSIFTDTTHNFNLPVGEYYVMPYLHFDQEIPAMLISSLGAVTDFDYRFLKLPYKRQLPIIRVVE